MEILKLKAHEKMLEFKTMDYITIYGIYDDEATFGDALNSFFNNYNYKNKNINLFSFYSDHLKRYITEIDLIDKINTYNMPKITTIKLFYNNGNQWTTRNNEELEIKYCNIDINIKIYKKNKNRMEYESEFKINVHYCLEIKELKKIIDKKTELLPSQYDLYHDRLMSDYGIIYSYKIKNGDKINLIKKSEYELEEEKILIISVKYGDKIIKCDTNDQSIIFDIKKKILEKEKILISKQCLKYKKINLNDNELVCNYGIKKDDILILTVINDNKNLGISIITLTGIKTDLNIDENCTIYDIKYLIFKKDDIPIDTQKLIYNKQLLSDEQKISKYNITEKSLIYMVLRLRGGMYHETSGRNGGFMPLKKKIFRIISNCS